MFHGEGELIQCPICVHTGCGDSISFLNNGFPVKVNLHLRTAWSSSQPEIELWNTLSVACSENTVASPNTDPSCPPSQHCLCKSFIHTLSKDDQLIKDLTEEDRLKHHLSMLHETLQSSGHKYCYKPKPDNTNISQLCLIILFCFKLISVNLLLKEQLQLKQFLNIPRVFQCYCIYQHLAQMEKQLISKQKQFISPVHLSVHSRITCPTCNLNDQFFLPLASTLRKRIYLLASAR